MRFTDEEQRVLFDKLERELGPVLRAALQDETVLEICVNHDGHVRIERRGTGWEETGEVFSSLRTLTLLNTIATMQGLCLTRTSPILQSWIPGYGARIQGSTEPIVHGTVFAIRKPSVHTYTLADYVHAGRMSVGLQRALEAAIARRESVLVVGGTGSGKTTLVNALLHAVAEVEPDARLLLLEDTRELKCMRPQWVQFETMPPSVTLEVLLHNALRMRPDRIIVGEVRGPEALWLLQAWNTGHAGGISTVHANGAEAGLLRLEQLVASRSQMARIEIAEAVKTVVFIERGRNGPIVRSAMRVLGLKPDGYLLEEIT